MRKPAKILLLVVMLVALLPLPNIHIPAVEGATEYTMTIRLVNTGTENLTYYPIRITLGPTWKGWSTVAVNGSDIYFTDADGNPLWWYAETWNYTGRNAVLWVQVPSIPANTTTEIVMHWGNPANVPRTKITQYNMNTQPGDTIAPHLYDWYFASTTYSLTFDYGLNSTLTEYFRNNNAITVVSEIYLITRSLSSINMWPKWFRLTTNYAFSLWFDIYISPYTVRPQLSFLSRFYTDGRVAIFYADSWVYVDFNVGETGHIFGSSTLVYDRQTNILWKWQHIICEEKNKDYSTSSTANETNVYNLFNYPDSNPLGRGSTNDKIEIMSSFTGDHFSSYVYYLYMLKINETITTRTTILEQPLVLLDPTFFNGTHYFDLVNGVAGTPYGGVSRVPASEKWLWLIKGLRSDSYVHLDWFPAGTIVSFNGVNYTVPGDPDIVADYALSLAGGTYNVTAYIPYITRIETSGYVPGLVQVFYQLDVEYSIENPYVADPYADPPNATIAIRDSAGNVVAEIPFSELNTTVFLLENNTYTITIPLNGSTIGGRGFVTEYWVIGDKVNATSLTFLGETKLYIKMKVVSYPRLESYMNIALTAEPSTEKFVYSGLIYGGSVFDYNRLTENGLIATIDGDVVTAPQVYYLDKTYTSISVSAILNCTGKVYYYATSGLGEGIALNGYDSEGIGVFINTSDIYIAEIHYDASQTVPWIADRVLWRASQNFYHVQKRVYVQLSYVNSEVDVSIFVYNVTDGYTWQYTVKITNYAITPTHITLLVKRLATSTGLIGNVYIMRSNRLRVNTFSDNFYIVLDGIDNANHTIHYVLSNNGYGDLDYGEYSMEFIPPAFFPVNGTLTIYVPKVPMPTINFTGKIFEYEVPYFTKPPTLSPGVNTSAWKSFNPVIIQDFAQYKDLVAFLVIVVVAMIANQVNAPLFAMIVSALAVFFTVIGWLGLPSGALGLLVLIASLVWVVHRKST